MINHLPHVKEDQDSPYWVIKCSCSWSSGPFIELDAAVEKYGQHIMSMALNPITTKVNEIWTSWNTSS